MLSQRICLALAVASLTVVRAIAIIVPEPDLDKLVDNSNLIVVGELITVEPSVGSAPVEINGKPVKVRVDRGTLRVDEILRGSQYFPFSFEIPVPQQVVGWSLPVKQNYGLFFFRTSPEGKIALTDLYQSYLPIPRGLNSRGNTAIDRVVSILEICSLFQTAEASI